MTRKPRSTFKYTYIFFIIGAIIGLSNLFLKLNSEISDTFFNIIFSGIQIIVILIVLYFYFSSFSTVDNIDDISKRPADIIIRSVDAKIVQNIINKAKKTIESCLTLWLSIVIGWLILYGFLFSYGLGFIKIDESTKGLILRAMNHFDTLQMLFMYTLFSVTDPNLNFKVIFKRSLPFIYSLVFIFSIDVLNFAIFEIEWIGLVLNILGALISSITFLMFFSRLDSILIQFNKLILSVFMLYGIFQGIYPLLFTNAIYQNEVQLFLFLLGVIVSSFGKIGLAIIFSRKVYLERLVYYFSSIYFLAPITNKNLSIGHTFYATKTKYKSNS